MIYLDIKFNGMQVLKFRFMNRTNPINLYDHRFTLIDGTRVDINTLSNGEIECNGTKYTFDKFLKFIRSRREDIGNMVYYKYMRNNYDDKMIFEMFAYRMLNQFDLGFRDCISIEKVGIAPPHFGKESALDIADICDTFIDTGRKLVPLVDRLPYNLVDSKGLHLLGTRGVFEIKVIDAKKFKAIKAKYEFWLDGQMKNLQRTIGYIGEIKGNQITQMMKTIMSSGHPVHTSYHANTVDLSYIKNNLS